jgi:zinc transport system substrate-binding protein
MRNRPRKRLEPARLASPFAVALAGVVLAGCGTGSASGDAGTSVVAGSYPFAFVAERVAAPHASVDNVTPPGAEPHDVELSPQQVAAVAEADVVVFEQGFQPALDDAVADNAQGALVDVAAATEPSAAQAAEPSTGAEDTGHDHDHETVADPHVWQDPTQLVPVADAVADALAEADPKHASAYRRNAAELVRDLRALDTRLRQGLEECERRTFVTSHAAFGHLARRYDLRMLPIAGISPEDEPSPARLAELRDVVQEEGITTVFTETLASPALARTLADEVGVRTAVLDPIEGLTEATADEDYFSLMTANLAALRRANGCS